MFKELLKLATKNESVKWFVLGFSVLSLGAGFFFLHTIIESQVRAHLLYSVVHLVLFFLLAIIGFAVFYLNSELYTRYYFYLIVVHCLINLICLFVGIYTVHPNQEVLMQFSEEVKKFKKETSKNPSVLLDAWQLSLACCGASNASEYITGQNKQGQDEYKLPVSCCDELDQNIECSPKTARQKGCWTAFRQKVKHYRIVAFILLALSVILQVLLIVAYSRTLGESEE